MGGDGRRPRFFVPDQVNDDAPFRPGDDLVLPTSEAHHAAHVLRLNVGAAVELFDGRGGSALGHLRRVHRGEVIAAVDEAFTAEARPPPLIHLAFSVPKGRRLDWLLEKATELNVASLMPVRFERSVAGTDEFSPAKRDRWLGHCISAAKQAGLTFLPDLCAPQPLSGLLAAADWGIYGDLVGSPAALPDVLSTSKPWRTLYIVVGPEGGFTDGERGLLGRAGFAAVRLGHTTLRTETAALALVAGALALYGTP